MRRLNIWMLTIDIRMIFTSFVFNYYQLINCRLFIRTYQIEAQFYKLKAKLLFTFILKEVSRYNTKKRQQRQNLECSLEKQSQKYNYMNKAQKEGSGNWRIVLQYLQEMMAWKEHFGLQQTQKFQQVQDRL
ncbi:unnamed protein product [Paramecium octaurelia]|uniref:Uncharacterized protein n=1 Tax=Paramecium octaurelia TaxID=43137 RepID=A0A8S1XR26_PAROT|nr:unnamed protein product [Paramecium octaurelia]